MNLKNKKNIILRISVLLIFLLFIFDILFQNSKHTKYIFSKNFINFEEFKPSNYFSEKKTDQNIRYFVQLGIFAKHSEVDKIKAKTNLLGLNPKIENYLLSGKLTKKVILGPYFNKKIFEKTLNKLDKNNIKYRIVNE